MEHKDFSQWRVKPKSSFKLHDIDSLPEHKNLPSEDEWHISLNKLGDKLNKLQGTLHAGKSKGLLLVLPWVKRCSLVVSGVLCVSILV